MPEFQPLRSGYIQLNENGVSVPEANSFPPLVERVDQSPDVYKPFVDYAVQRSTVQWHDNCNLSCPGCYAKPWLAADGAHRLENERQETPEPNFYDQLTAHGGALRQIYFLGLEPTLKPHDTASRLRTVHSLGMSSVVATNGARPVERFTEAFGEAIESGMLQRINISLDSMDMNIHNHLRGKSFAFARTLETIQHAVAEDLDFQVTMTVWADNYHTIVESVQALYDMGVRGFVFHEGSLEGAPDYMTAGVRRIDPYAWRALISQLENIKHTYAAAGNLRHFVFPYIYFTESELRTDVIGNDELTDAYLQHVSDQENGKDSSLPFVACPAVDVPQVYLFGNDGEHSSGAISLCNMHTVQTHKYLAEYNPDTKEFETELDPNKNQMVDMVRSPNLCPARSGVTRDGNPSDRYNTPSGDIYHGCRYISSNQLPHPDVNFGNEAYVDIWEYYKTRWNLIRDNPGALDYCDKVQSLDLEYATKTTLLEKFIDIE